MPNYICTASVLNVRSGASTKYPVVAKFKKNDVIYPSAPVSNGWLKCKIYNGEGYVSATYIKAQGSVKPVTPVKPTAPVGSKFNYFYKNGCHVVEINPKNLKFDIVDKAKKSCGYKNYFNAGFFGKLSNGSTLAGGNIASDGKILVTSEGLPSWTNLYNKDLTTFYIRNDNSMGLIKTKNMKEITNLKCAISGIPIVDSDGMETTLAKVKSEGYFGNELYTTWHCFLTFTDTKVVIIYANIGSIPTMRKKIESLGYGKHGAIKLDGGGSAILVVNGIKKVCTAENRRISSIGVFE